jgi:glycosyltransferase involved in cell wall biosynthesis
LNREFNGEQPDGRHTVEVSVVIPCRNEADTLGAQLSSLVTQQTTCTFEVIIADNGSTDGTAAVVRQFSREDPRVRIVDASSRVGINAARNIGVGSARAPVILLCDADDVVQPGWIEAFWLALSNGAQCVGGGVDYILPDGRRGHSERQLYFSVSNRPPYALGANCGFVIDAFIAIGGFDESFAGGADEIEFFWRAASAGYPLTLVPEAVIDKRMRTALRALYRQQYSYGKGRARLNRKFGQSRSALALQIARSIAQLGWAVGRGLMFARDPVVRRGTVQRIGWSIGVLAESARAGRFWREETTTPPVVGAVISLHRGTTGADERS